VIDLTRAALRQLLRRLLHTRDTPERTAAAYALGVFWGYSPLLGLHTVLGVGSAFALRLNRVAAVLGVYSNLPWTMAPYYTLATVAGAALLGVPVPDGLIADIRLALNEFTARNVGRLLDTLAPLLWTGARRAVVDAARREQFLVRARLAQLALVQHQDGVHVLDGREPVRDGDRRASRISTCRASRMSSSVSVSTLEVASSRTSTRGSNASARANDSSCFCPTESVAPRSADTRVEALGRRSMKRSACTAIAARRTTASSVDRDGCRAGC
jgi:uncharacterized protein (DUF2062 family)